MLKKINLFLSLTTPLCLLSLNALSYDVIAPKDEALLKGVVDSHPTIEEEAPTVLTPSSTLLEDLDEIENTTKEDIIPRTTTFPTKEERAQNRTEETEWFKPRVKDIILPGTLSSLDANDPYIEEIKSSIHSCLNNKQDELTIEQSLLKEGNLYDNTAYISQTFEDINTCYENIGYQIISVYYNDDEWTLQNYQKKLKTFYISSSDANFDTSHCLENCSLDAMIKNQIDKFTQFRTYLSELLANRPKARK